MAAPALDDLAAIWADICLLCDRHGSKLLNGKVSRLPDLLLVGRHPSDNDGHGNVGYVPMAITGYLEQAKARGAAHLHSRERNRRAPARTMSPRPVFLAWAKEERAGRCLDAAMAMLAMLASQALHVTERPAPPALQAFVDEIRAIVPPVGDDRVLGPELARLAEWFTRTVFGSNS